MADPYNELVRECFFWPAHVGDAVDGAVAYFDDQGVRIRLSASISGSAIEVLRFRAWGCPHVVAAAELFCRLYESQDTAKLEEFSSDQIMVDLAVPVEKTGRILVLEDTVRSLRAAIHDRIDLP